MTVQTSLRHLVHYLLPSISEWLVIVVGADIERRTIVLRRVDREHQRDEVSSGFDQTRHLPTPLFASGRRDCNKETDKVWCVKIRMRIRIARQSSHTHVWSKIRSNFSSAGGSSVKKSVNSNFTFVDSDTALFARTLEKKMEVVRIFTDSKHLPVRSSYCGL